MPPKKTAPLPAAEVQEVKPAPPVVGLQYSEDEVEAMTTGERLWYDNHRDLPECQEDLIGYDSGSACFTCDSNVTEMLMRPAPPVAAEPLRLRYEEDPLKLLKGWPEEHPRFKGGPGDDAVTWLSRLAVILSDRRAHPEIWHTVAGQRLGGKAFDDHSDAALDCTRPNDWAVGTSSAGPARELDALQQGPNETLQAFYARFLAWMSRARAHGFQFDPITCFIKRLNKGLSRKVSEEISRAEVRRERLDMSQVVCTAMDYDSLYRATSAVASTSSGSGKRRSDEASSRAGKKKLYSYNCRSKNHLLADCREEKTDRQKAYEAKHPPIDKKKKKEKKSSRHPVTAPILTLLLLRRGRFWR
ncbi:hypothetical protein PTTG_28314 [Puccinia triticina 1-1 BBBD Race 1]|uniref:Uncharacterized protein n=1 Tax=Puccinia triticina (isolate 1-1 / race 1 (BBBD)) TaxID=630390 RepID=A0A180GCF4_PUCT1|nr:hypothetical protein PTTG_28314 [Puccinia triticina 1-1 BBBD Race 1]